ncbi:MAG: hypothetical protein PHU77_06665 [Simplicispira sp.]|nr:hypothetical protein [Simplicispira sp.]
MTFDRRSTGYKPQPNQATALNQQAQSAIKVAAKKHALNTSAQPSK